MLLDQAGGERVLETLVDGVKLGVSKEKGTLVRDLADIFQDLVRLEWEDT